jgi:hypothetical protein
VELGKTKNVRQDAICAMLVLRRHRFARAGGYVMNSAEFRTGHVLRQAGAASWAHAVSWIAVAALVQSPLIFQAVSGLSRTMRSHLALAALSAVATGTLLIITQTAVTSAMVAHLRGRRATLAELLRMAFHLPASLLRLAVAYGGVCGLLSLVPPPLGIYASLGFTLMSYFYCSVAIPVLVIEQSSVIEAFRRTVSLTSVHGAYLLGIHLRVILLWLVLLVPVTLAVNAIVSPDGRGPVFEMALTFLSTISAGVVGTAIYRELRLCQEGIEFEHLPVVPDARVHAQS